MTAKEQLNIILTHVRLNIPQFSEKVGVNKSTFYSMEKGLSLSFSSRTAIAICNIYKEIDYNMLISGNTPKTAPEKSGGISKPTPKDTIKIDTLRVDGVK